jgi:hypothetical protein
LFEQIGHGEVPLTNWDDAFLLGFCHRA